MSGQSQSVQDGGGGPARGPPTGRRVDDPSPDQRSNGSISSLSQNGSEVLRPMVRRVVRRVGPGLEEQTPSAPEPPKPTPMAISVPKSAKVPSQASKQEDDISMGLTSLMGRGRTKEHRARSRAADRREAKEENVENQKPLEETMQEVPALALAATANPPKEDPLAPPVGFLPSHKPNPLNPPTGANPSSRPDPLAPPKGFIPPTKVDPLAPPTGFIPPNRAHLQSPPTSFIPPVKADPLAPPTGFIPAPKPNTPAPPASIGPSPKPDPLAPPAGFVPAPKRDPLSPVAGFIPRPKVDPLAPPAGFIPAPRPIAVRKHEVQMACALDACTARNLVPRLRAEHFETCDTVAH
ncbi:uncharacterized protein [Hoplias malabaricus]|uniref:uncharacterized protein n=1 Tax=Hoplias malabaricus TaxID=27720 RepID=UPI0034630B1F